MVALEHCKYTLNISYIYYYRLHHDHRQNKSGKGVRVLKSQFHLLSTTSKLGSTSVQRNDLYPPPGMKSWLSNICNRELVSREADGLKATVPTGDGADLESSLKLLQARKELSMVLAL